MCTGIKVDYDKGCVIGRTMDFEVPVNYNALYFPKGYNFCDDLMGNPIHSKYKALGVCFSNKDPLKDGVNEYGLAGITNTFTGFNLYDNKVEEGKINISSLDYFNYALTHYKSVEELVEDLPNIHFSSRDHRGEKVITPDFHFMFSDSTKRCIVVEPKKGKILYYENPYNVMTNSPRFESHVKRLHNYYDLENLEDFNSSKDLPGGYDPFSRFIKSFYLVKTNTEPENSHGALSHFYNIMNSMVMPEGFVKNKKYDETTFTRYTCGYDTDKKLLTVKSHTDPTVYNIGFDDIEDENKRQEFFINKEFTSKTLV